MQPNQAQPQNPLIVQSDHTVLAEVDNPLYPEARDALARFAELVKSPEHIHTYRITPLSIWNARAIGDTAETVIETRRRDSKYALPQHLEANLFEYAARYGCLRLTSQGDALLLTARDLPLAEELARREALFPYLRERIGAVAFLVPAGERGRLKQALIKLGFPTEDLVGYVTGEPLELDLRPVTLGGAPFHLRPYQREAADLFHLGGGERGGSGVIALPCGAGKTISSAHEVMNLVRSSTLILATSVTAARQWREELLDKTTLPSEAIGDIPR